MNDRYNTNADEKRVGKTRKSSASAKPNAQRAATVREPAPKTAKQKKEEAREREPKAAQKANFAQALFEDTPGYKRLRRTWWIALGVAIGCTALSFFLQSSAINNGAAMALMIVAYGAIIFAFWLDFGKIRKERKLYNASIAQGKSKEARKEQKKMRAEMRAQEKEAAEKYEAAKAEEEAKEASRGKGLLARFRKGSKEEAEGGASDKEADKQADAAK